MATCSFLPDQGKPDDNFPKRMFTYGYRIYDKYQQPIVSCAVLTDARKAWRPNCYKIGLAGSYLSTEFLVVKLMDYQDKKAELEISDNPFASVILVQLAALENKKKPDEQRKQVKFALTKRLYEKGYNKSKICYLYKFIDWLIGLPKPLELEYLNDVYQLEGSKKMPYITSAERFGMEIGMKKGLEQGIEKEKLIIAERLLLKKAKLSFIEEVTGLSLAKIKKIQKKSHH